MHIETLVQGKNIFNFIEFLNVTFSYFVEEVRGTALHTDIQKSRFIYDGI